LSLGLLAYLVGIVDVRGIAGVLAGTDPVWLGLAAVLYLAGQALSAVKWRLLASAVGFRGPLLRFVAVYFVGMFFNAFGLGTVGGDVVRALYLAGGERRALALNTVVADRASGLLVLLTIAMASLLAFRTYELPAVLYWTTLSLCGALAAGWWAAPLLLPRLLPAGHRWRKLVEEDLAPYWQDARLLGAAAGLSAIFHLSQIGVLAALARALRLEIPGTYFFIFGPLVNVFSALPVSWNGLGVRESGYLFFLGHIGLGRESAVAFGLLWLGIVLAGGALGGIVYVFLGDRVARTQR
jgi:hypothetical protein